MPDIYDPRAHGILSTGQFSPFNPAAVELAPQPFMGFPPANLAAPTQPVMTSQFLPPGYDRTKGPTGAPEGSGQPFQPPGYEETKAPTGAPERASRPFKPPGYEIKEPPASKPPKHPAGLGSQQPSGAGSGWGGGGTTGAGPQIAPYSVPYPGDQPAGAFPQVPSIPGGTFWVPGMEAPVPMGTGGLFNPIPNEPYAGLTNPWVPAPDPRTGPGPYVTHTIMPYGPGVGGVP